MVRLKADTTYRQYVVSYRQYVVSGFSRTLTPYVASGFSRTPVFYRPALAGPRCSTVRL
jgi:hypothetical protein